MSQQEKIRNFTYIDHYNEFSIGDIVYYDYFSYNGKSRITRFAIILKICREEIDISEGITYSKPKPYIPEWKTYHQAYVRWFDTSLDIEDKINDPKRISIDLRFWKKINIQLLKKVNL